MSKEFKSVTIFSFPFIRLSQITRKDIKSCLFGNIERSFFFFWPKVT